jgi:hypothetical protein
MGVRVLTKRVMDIYSELPYWSRVDLLHRYPVYRWSGHSRLGWSLVYNENDFVEIADRKHIPLLPESYMGLINYIYNGGGGFSKAVIHSGRYKPEVLHPKLPADLIQFIVGDGMIECDIGGEVLAGFGENLLEASMDLYSKACAHYMVIRMPSAAEFDDVEEVFIDRDGHFAIELRHDPRAYIFPANILDLEKYSRFCSRVNYVNTESELEQCLGVITLVEGEAKIYINYDVHTVPVSTSPNYPRVRGISSGVSISHFGAHVPPLPPPTPIGTGYDKLKQELLEKLVDNLDEEVRDLIMSKSLSSSEGEE